MRDKKRSLVKRTLHYYWQAAKRYKWLAIGCIICTIIVCLVDNILMPLVVSDAIEKASEGLPADAIVGDVMPMVVGYVLALIISELGADKLRLRWIWLFECRVMYDLADLCFITIAAQSMQFHNDRMSGSLVNQVSKFYNGFDRICDSLIWDLLPLVINLTAIFIILMPQAPVFTILMLAFVILFTAIARVAYRKIAVLAEKEAAATTKTTGQLADSLSNILAVKSYAKEEYERKRYNRFQRVWMDASIDVMKASNRRNYAFAIVWVGLRVLVLLLVLFGSGWFGLSVSTMILLFTYSQSILGQLWMVNPVMKDFNTAIGDAKEMIEILDMKDDVVDEPGATALRIGEAEVDFSHITFQHKDTKEPLFSDFNLEVSSGERIGLVGLSGSGKTTLTKLLLRFADVADGAIMIDGQNIRNVTQDSLRSAIAYVPQETALFHRTIADNIAYARPDATAAEIERAAKLASADEFIKELPKGYQTLVGERGVKLSGGQRQRIAIARAILKNAPILVLDEATSALDSESEAAIQAALEELMKERTSIVIAHRLSTVASLDRIVVLDKGRIVEQGTHKELLAKNGEYAKLWVRQSGGFLDK